jgi:hypothetical protein
MATAGKAKSFNYELFRKRVRLFDSSADGERDLAVTQALKQCAQSDPPMHFWEAAGTAFGFGESGNEEVEELKERAATAQEESAHLRRSAERQEQVCDQLRNENARLAEKLDRVANEVKELRAPEWPQIWVLRPQVLLVAAGIVVALEWFAITPLGISWLADRGSIIAEWLHAIAMGIFVVWSVALWKCDGAKKVFEQWVVWTSCWVPCAVWMWVLDRHLAGVGFQQLLVPYRWWATMGVGFSLPDCGLVFFGVAIAVDRNLGSPVGRFVWALMLVPFSWIEDKML